MNTKNNPVDILPEYQAKGIFKNGYLNTFYPYAFRKKLTIPYQRKRITTFDDDFIDLDFVRKGNKKVAILLHGLEGSSSSQYIVGAAHHLSQHGWDICAVNHRSCSGEINKSLTMYHSGWTYDLPKIIDTCLADYEQLTLIGYSLGGNMALKYAGEQGENLHPAISDIVAFSVPVDLGSGAQELLKKRNRIFVKVFMDTLGDKIKAKAAQYPDKVDLSLLSKIKTLKDFDDFYSAPLHGFVDANDYYEKCSSLPLLNNIRRSSLLVNASDDPFLGSLCFPHEIAKKNKHFYFIETKYGGHVGFGQIKNYPYWSDEVIYRFLEKDM